MLTRDLVHASRGLRKTPAFTVTAILTIALGIGASTAIFSVVNAVLLRPLPYRDAGRLVFIESDMKARGVEDFPFSPPDFADIRASANLLEDVSGVFTGTANLVSGKYAVIENAYEFTLVPWRPVMEERLGRQISGVVRASGISWDFVRSRGLGIGM